MPGLFQGEDLKLLLTSCRDAERQSNGGVDPTSHDNDHNLNSDTAIWQRFTRRVQRNLHVVFTINPSSVRFDNRYAASPALFNRCVVQWLGTWSEKTLGQISTELISPVLGDLSHLSEEDAFMLGSNSEAGAVLLALTHSTHHSDHDDEGTGTASLTECIGSAMICIHRCVKEFMETMRDKTGRAFFVSPRHFLCLIDLFVETVEKFRIKLNADQKHTQTGLTKLLEAQQAVGSLREEALHFEKELRHKDAEANRKLSLMVDKQKEAEQRKVEAQMLAQELQSQNEKVTESRSTVEKELSEAEPALQIAKESVSAISRQQLDEVRALGRPPKQIQLTLEMVALMMGEPDLDWSEIRKVVRRDDFIYTVVNFDPLVLTESQVDLVTRKYLSKDSEGFTYESVNRASKACGPLFSWASSQIRYATILRRIEPLRVQVVSSPSALLLYKDDKTRLHARSQL